jgi:hypothetical protein
MKKITRILSVALVAMMVLSLAAVAVAETPSVYIPKRLAKLVDAYVEDYVYPSLVTKTDAKYNSKIGHMVANTDDGVIHFQFSEKPDWFGASVSVKDGGWINIDIDDSGYGELEMEDLTLQPGASYTNRIVDKDGNVIKANVNSPSAKTKAWMEENEYEFIQETSGDEAYFAGKDYGDYSVVVSYHRDGSPYQVAVSLKNTDLFRTGMEGAISTITFKLVNVELDSYTKLAEAIEWDAQKEENVLVNPVKPNNKYTKTVRNKRTGEIDYVEYDGKQYPIFFLASTDIWYVGSVSAAYPAGNYIVGVEADYRNDAKNNLSQYKVSYAVSENDVAEIYYRPWDSPFYGQYSRNDAIIAVSGSGNNLNKWYKYNGFTENAVMKVRNYDKDGKFTKYTYETVAKINNNGKQVKNIKKGISSYPSPRVK